MTHRKPDLLRIFTEGEDLLCYEIPDELVSQLRYCLENPERAAQIAETVMRGNARPYLEQLFSNLLQMMVEGGTT